MTAPLTDVFRVYLYDLNTNTKIAEAKAIGLTFDSRLNDAGSCTFGVDLQDPANWPVAAAIEAYQGTPIGIYIDRDGTIVWGGLSGTGSYDSSTHTQMMGGKEFCAYFAQRVAAQGYDAAAYPSGVDPAALLAAALTDMQSAALCGPGASLGITIVGGTSSLPLIVPSYSQAQWPKVSQIMSDLCATTTPGTGGIDVTVTCSWDAYGNPARTLRIWSPRAGRPAGTTGLIINLDRAANFTWPTDSTLGGTTIIATGSGTGSVAPLAIVQSPYPVGGLGQSPRLDLVIPHRNVNDQAQLSQIAAGEAQQYGGALITPTATIPTAAVGMELGSWLMGDDCRLLVAPRNAANPDVTPGNARFPNGLDQYWRIVQHTVTVPDAGVPTVKLAFNAPPIF